MSRLNLDEHHLDLGRCSNLLRQKDELEHQLIQEPLHGEEVLRAHFLEVLEQIDRSFSGIAEFRWPGLRYPVFFRCGSTDLRNFRQIFIRRELGFGLPYSPRRILDLGAYVGFAAIFLAQRFPGAEIFCVEPSPDNFRLLSLNTLGYQNISRLNAAVWDKTESLKIESFSAGDWGTQVASISSKPSSGGQAVAGLSLEDILAHAGWDKLDFLKCDIEGAELGLFPASVSLISKANACCIEIHDAAFPGSCQAVLSCFDHECFSHARSGEYDLFVRRGANIVCQSVGTEFVLRPTCGLRPIRLLNVPAKPWGFYLFAGNSCQLHPTSRNPSPAELTTTVSLERQSHFVCQAEVINPLGHPVSFSLNIFEQGESKCLVSETLVVGAGERRPWRVPVGILRGMHRVSLGTSMVGNLTNHQARANWLAPRFE
jgi:FkbM family methyltransferase